MSKQDIARLERDEPERLERRADGLRAEAKHETGTRQISLLCLSFEARKYAANLRAMRAARLRNDMV